MKRPCSQVAASARNRRSRAPGSAGSGGRTSATSSKRRAAAGAAPAATAAPATSAATMPDLHRQAQPGPGMLGPVAQRRRQRRGRHARPASTPRQQHGAPRDRARDQESPAGRAPARPASRTAVRRRAPAAAARTARTGIQSRKGVSSSHSAIAASSRSNTWPRPKAPPPGNSSANGHSASSTSAPRDSSTNQCARNRLQCADRAEALQRRRQHGARQRARRCSGRDRRWTERATAGSSAGLHGESDRGAGRGGAQHRARHADARAASAAPRARPGSRGACSPRR